MKIKMRGLGVWVLGLVLLAVSCWLLAVFSDARYLKYRQTDPQDIVTRDKIDRDIDSWIERLDRQTQADTVLLAAGTSQVVQLDNKYKDTDYQVFLQIRVLRGSQNNLYVIMPTTDSSFTITKHTDDLSTVQWMSIHK